MVLITPQDLLDGYIRDVCCQSFQVLLYRIIILSIPSNYYAYLSSPLNRRRSWGSVWPYICMIGIFLLVFRLETQKTLNVLKTHKNIVKNKCLSYVDIPTKIPQGEPNLDHPEILDRHKHNRQSSRFVILTN